MLAYDTMQAAATDAAKPAHDKPITNLYSDRFQDRKYTTRGPGSTTSQTPPRKQTPEMQTLLKNNI